MESLAAPISLQCYGWQTVDDFLLPLLSSLVGEANISIDDFFFDETATSSSSSIITFTPCAEFLSLFFHKRLLCETFFKVFLSGRSLLVKVLRWVDLTLDLNNNLFAHLIFDLPLVRVLSCVVIERLHSASDYGHCLIVDYFGLENLDIKK